MCTGKYSSSVGASADMLCTACVPYSTSLEASVSEENCTCNQGFHILKGSQCIDIDECELTSNRCNHDLFTCVNTIGSYLCINSSIPNIPICDGPIPNSCDVNGGNSIWIKIPGVLDGQFFSVQIDQQFLEAQYHGSYISTVCPSSDSVGQKLSYVLRANSSIYCTFSFMYKPAPAKITPRIVPLSGGKINIQLKHFWEYIGSIRKTCRVLFGSIAGDLFQLDANTYNLSIVAPPSGMGRTVSLHLQCGELGSLNDLHVYLEYVGSSSPSINGAGKCIRFQRCELSIGLTNPPRAVNGPQDLDLRVLGAQFAAYDDGKKSFRITEVRNRL